MEIVTKISLYATGVNKKTGELYENHLFIFKVNDPSNWRQFFLNTYYRFKNNGNKIHALYITMNTGRSVRVNELEFSLIVEEQKILTDAKNQTKQITKELRAMIKKRLQVGQSIDSELLKNYGFTLNK